MIGDKIKTHNLAAWDDMRGSRFSHCTFDTFETPTSEHNTVRNQARRAALQNCNVLLIGPSGTGKDHLMSAMVRWKISAGELEVWEPRYYTGRVYWSSGAAILSAFRRFDDDETISALKRVSLLCVSDPVASSELTAFQAERWLEVIDERYNHERPTWITANVKGFNDLAAKMTVPIADRLKEGAAVIQCNWESYRVVGHG